MPKGNGIVSVENGAVVIHSVWVGLGWGEVREKTDRQSNRQ